MKNRNTIVMMSMIFMLLLMMINFGKTFSYETAISYSGVDKTISPMNIIMFSLWLIPKLIMISMCISTFMSTIENNGIYFKIRNDTGCLFHMILKRNLKLISLYSFLRILGLGFYNTWPTSRIDVEYIINEICFLLVWYFIFTLMYSFCKSHLTGAIVLIMIFIFYFMIVFVIENGAMRNYFLLREHSYIVVKLTSLIILYVVSKIFINKNMMKEEL